MKATAEIQFAEYIPITLTEEIEAALDPSYSVKRRPIPVQVDHFEAVDIMDIIVYIDEHQTEWIANNIVGPTVLAGVALIARGVFTAMSRLAGPVIRKLSGGKIAEPSCMINFRYRDAEFDVTLKGNVPPESVTTLVSQLTETMERGGKKTAEPAAKKQATQQKPRIRVTYNPTKQIFVAVDQKAAEESRAELLKKLNDLSS